MSIELNHSKWKMYNFNDVFTEYSKSNTENLEQFTVGKYGLIPKSSEGYSYDVNNKTYSKISAIGALYDTGHIKHISEKSYLGNSNNIFNAFDPFFHIEDTYLHYVIKYKLNSNGYNVKIEDYIFKDTAIPHGTWYYSKDNSYTYSRHNIEIGRVTDEDVAKPDLSSYTFVEN